MLTAHLPFTGCFRLRPLGEPQQPGQVGLFALDVGIVHRISLFSLVVCLMCARHARAKWPGWCQPSMPAICCRMSMSSASSHVRRHHVTMSIIDGSYLLHHSHKLRPTSSLLYVIHRWCAAFTYLPHTFHSQGAHSCLLACRLHALHPPYLRIRCRPHVSSLTDGLCGHERTRRPPSLS